MGKHVDDYRAEDMPTQKAYGQRAIMRRMLANPAGTSDLMRAIMSTSATAPENVVIDLRD